MSKNIEINIQTASNTYETLYPKTLGSNIDGAVSLATKATSADSLTNSRTIQTNLASTSSASFNGTSNITPGVSGVLPVGNGGTGTTSYSSLASYISPYLSTSKQLYYGSYTGTGSTTQKVNYPQNYPYAIIIYFPWQTSIATTTSNTYFVGLNSFFLFWLDFSSQVLRSSQSFNTNLEYNSSQTTGNVCVGKMDVQYYVTSSYFEIRSCFAYAVDPVKNNTKATVNNALSVNNLTYYYILFY